MKTLVPILVNLTFILILLPQGNSSNFSLMKYYQAQETLINIIKIVKSQKQSNATQQIPNCGRTNTCCKCQKQFKNYTYLQLHMSIYHPINDNSIYQSMLIQIFDKKINSQFRFETCLKYLSVVSNLHDINQQKSKSFILEALNQVQKNKKVEICTIAAYGMHQQPLWVIWVKGTLIFVFIIISLVYYSNLFDQIKKYYFPKQVKQKKRNYQRPNIQQSSGDQQVLQIRIN